MIFYLKVNRLIDYTLRNLQVWVNIIAEFGDAHAYILCDNEGLSNRIKKEINFKGISWELLESCRDEKYSDLVNAISVTNWHNAAYAHLTPFIHARRNNYLEFWNIDADDTLFCASPERVVEMLQKARCYARKHDIDLFSLDMWRSRSYSMHWSFGITYTNGDVDWLDIMKQHISCENGSMYFMNGNHAKNIDEYFTYIRATDMNVRIETFCFNNLLFVHYSDDFIMNPIISGVFRWKGNKLEFPIIKYVYGIDSLGDIEIAKDVIKLDVGLNDFEGGWALAQIAPFSLEATNIIEAKEYEKLREELAIKQMKNNINSFISKIQKLSKVYIFGFGKYTDELINILRSYDIEAKAILDNAEFKWGGPINGLYVCSPEILKKENNIKDIAVLIDVRHYKAITHQLIDYMVPEEHVFIVIDYSRMR